MPLADAGTAAMLGVGPMTTAEQFLRAKATLPA
jgi:hypothetical protein